MSIDNNDYENALKKFTKSISMFPNNKEGYIYRFLAYIASYLSRSKNKSDDIKFAKEEIILAMTQSKKNADLHYYMGMLELSQHNYSDAFYQFNKTIKYADDSSARDYFAKGIAEACLNMFKEAIDDLDIAVKLEEKFTDAHLLKGKCSYLTGDVNTAFSCYQKLILIDKSNYLMHIHAGNLLMNTGAVEDAIKALSNANKIEESSIAYYQQAKVCYLYYYSVT